MKNLRNICENDTVESSKNTSYSPQRNHSKGARLHDTNDSKLTMDKEVFGHYNPTQKSHKLRAKFVPKAQNNFSTNNFNTTTYGSMNTQEGNYFNFEIGDQLRDSIDRFDHKFKDRKCSKPARRRRFLKLRAEFDNSVDTIDDGSLSPPRYISKSRNSKMR